MGRLVLAILAGVLVAGFVIFLLEMPGQLLYPPPAGLDMSNPDAMSRYVAGLPAGAFAIVLLAWVVGAFGGAWVATRLAARHAIWPGLVIGGLELLGIAWNVMKIPHPVWMVAAAVLAVPVAAYFGAKLALRGKAFSAPA